MEVPQAPPPAPEAAVPADPRAELLARFPPLLDRAYAEIDAEEARWLQRHGALVLDARRSAAHAQGRLPGARSLSVWEDGLAEKLVRLDAEGWDPRAPVVIYCAGGGCDDSHRLAEKLWPLGWRNLRIYTGGFPDWEARGWPVERGGP